MKKRIKAIIRKAFIAVKDTMSGFVFLRRDGHRVRTQNFSVASVAFHPLKMAVLRQWGISISAKKIPCHYGRRLALRFHLGCGEHRRTMSQFLLYLFYEMIPALQTGRNDTTQKNAKCLRREIIAFLLFTFSFLLFTAGAARAGDNIINSNIGIGRTSTQANLHVGGSTIVDTDLTVSSNLSAAGLYAVASSGNVGIGTSSPAQELHIENTAGDTGIRLVDSGSGTVDISKSSSTGYSVSIGGTGTTEFTIQNDSDVVVGSGNVGIGTESPTAKLHVVGDLTVSASLTASAIFLENGTKITGGGEWADQGAYLEPGDANESVLIAKCLTVNTNVLVANNAGNVGVGTTAPEEKLHVVGDLTVTGSIYSAGKSVLGNDYTIPAFNAYAALEQTISTASWTQVELDTETFDTNSNFDTDTYRFTPTVAGKYLLASRINLNLLADGSFFVANIYKNGAGWTGGSRVAQGASSNNGSVVVAIAEANGTTDYFEVYVYHSHGSDRNIVSGDGGSYFAGIRIDAANGLWSQEANGVAYYSDGNVGIGTSAPDAELDVVGGLSVSGDLTITNVLSPSLTVYYAVVDEAGTLGKSGVSYPTGISTNKWVDQGAYLEPSDVNESVQIAKCLTVNTDVLVANNAGNVGIGTTAPEEKLHVVGDLTVTGSIYSSGKQVIANEYTMPAFSAFRTDPQTISATTWTKVQVDVEEFDLKANYDTGTYRFTPTLAGKYIITGRCSVSALDAGDYVYTAIYKNGIAKHSGNLVLAGGTAASSSVVSGVVDANGTSDYFELYVYHNYAGGDRDTGGAFFSGCRIDAANGLWAQEASSVAYYAGGNVGVGTSAPDAQLAVDGDLSAKDYLTVSGGGAYISGNVGVGTSTPVARLSVDAGGSGDQGQIGVSIGSADSTNRDFRIYKDTSTPYSADIYWGYHATAEGADLNFHASQDSGACVTFNSNTNVGIAQTSPSAMLHIGSTSNALGSTAGNDLDLLTLHASSANAELLYFTTERLSAGSTWETAAHRIQRQVDVTPMGYIQFGNMNTHLITFGEDATEYMRIDGNGNVGIGTYPNRAFQVYDNLATNYCSMLQNDGNNANRYGLVMRCGADDASGTNYAMAFQDGDATNQGFITFTSGTVTYNPFTASHNVCVPDSVNDVGYPYGTVVSLIASSSNPDKERQPIYQVVPSSKAYDKAVFGVYANKDVEADEENSHLIYVIGDGHIFVCADGGDIEIADFLTTSTREGYAMKQDDDLRHNYTVAKATQNVIWSEEAGDTKLISCTYHAQ